MDLTEIPDKLKKDKKYKYLLTIIDTFSKYAYAYLLNNKKSENILFQLKNFINVHGKCAKLHTDNGKEFFNSLITEYCESNDIILVHGRPYYPQSQGCIEAFNKELKKLLENLFLENKKKFSLKLCLPDALNIYNKNKHSTTKFNPIELFNSQDKEIIKQAIDNIKKFQSKFRNKETGFKVGTNVLLSENFELKGDTIRFKKLRKKGKYLIPCIIVGTKGGNEYVIIPALNIKNLKKNKKYNTDYKLVTQCYPSTWKKILSDLLDDN